VEVTEDWLSLPGVARLRLAHHALTPTDPDDADDAGQPAHQTGGPATVDLTAPEHRDKLMALFKWAAEGRSWDEIRDDAVRMVFPPRKPAEPR
jgi:hypothetical protein